ncbi:MAG: hypothetical protein ABIF01_01910, partial [Candidatus Micrarchaeota archaeon]
KSIRTKKTQLVGEKEFFNVDLPEGDYVLKIEDETGYVYAQSFLHVPKITITDERLDFINGVFTFLALADGRIIPANIEIKNISISLDGQQNTSLNTTMWGDGHHRALYRFDGAIPEGDHVITIQLGKNSWKLERTFIRKREWYDNPLYQGALVVVVVLFAVGMLIQRPETATFQIDVPDFPPLSKTKVPISREQSCEIFELVNADYRWKYMPLRHGEIKNGFRKLSYKGRPILVSDYNLERVLDQLVEEGFIKKSLDFYGLSSWVSESNKSMEYLAVFRSLRDTFLNMSIHFTEFGERADCDLVASAHEKYYIHIYSGEETATRALLTLSKGKSIIVFKNMDGVDAFLRGLSSTNKAMIVAKLYIYNENLFVATPSDIDKIIK